MLWGVAQDVVIAALRHPGPPATLRRLTVGWFSEFDGTPGGFSDFCDADINGVLRDISKLCAPRLTHLELPGFVNLRQPALAEFTA
eukprot:gene1963-593_t